MFDFQKHMSRRGAAAAIGGAAVIVASAGVAEHAYASSRKQDEKLSAHFGTGQLKTLGLRLAAAPRRRSFDTVPMIVTEPHDWDHEAAAELLSYKYESIQAWDNADLSGPWLGLMREAINGQVFAYKHSDFLAVSATHGNAHLALFSQSMWDKYQLARLTGGKAASNTFIVEHEGVSPDDDLQKPAGFYGPANNNIVSLQKRGVVFVGCHDSIHAISRMLQGDSAFAETPTDRIAGELTNNLIPGVVLVPSVVAFLVELQRAGYSYTRT